MMVFGSCKNCKSNWQIPDAPDFTDMEPDLVDIVLQALRIHCPTGICGGRLGTIQVILSLDPAVVVNSSQDGTGNPLYAGDTIRFAGGEHVIEAVKVGKNSAGASLLRLVNGAVVSEWSVDRIDV